MGGSKRNYNHLNSYKMITYKQSYLIHFIEKT